MEKLIIIFLFLTTTVYSQNRLDSVIVMNLVGKYKPINIEFIKDNKSIEQIESIGGDLLCKNLEQGYYTFRLSGHGTPYNSDSIYVKEGQLLQLNVTIDGPCLYDHPTDYIPICPKNHTDSIIPIVYGLVIKTDEQDSNEKRIHLGGCIVTDCDPKFYCEKHKVQF